MDMIRGMLAESPAEREYDLDISKTVIQFKGNRPGKITPVTSSTRGNEGARPTFVRPRRAYRLPGPHMTAVCRSR
ncbi:hypothetical protein EES41_23310 [Streptomyces sp. ADI95-16]|nr:hypothetical protein EES41_23310 [Streptomyces sp. ADI95-16]